MTKLWHIALHDLRVTFTEKGIWLNLVVIPIVLIFIIGVVNGGFGGNGGTVWVRVDVFDYDQSALSAQFLDELRAVNANLALCPMEDDEENVCRYEDEAAMQTMSEEHAERRVANNVVNAVLVIPEGFGAAALNGQPVNLLYRSEEQPGLPGLALQAVQTAAQRMGAATVAARVGVDVYENSGLPVRFAEESEREAFQQAVYDRAGAIWNGLTETVRYTQSIPQESSGNSGFSQSIPGMGSMYVMFTVLAGTFILLQERKQWTLQRLIMMPVARWQVTGGKMLARFIMGMVQYGVAFSFGALVLGVPFGNSPVALLLVMMSFVTCMTALAFLLATFVRNEMQASSVVTLLALTLAPLGGAWWPLEVVPEWMRTVGHLSPVAWAMDGFSTLIYRGGGIADVIVPVVVLFAAAAVIFFFALRRFRYD